MPPILQPISPHQGRGSGLHFDLGSLGSTRRHLSKAEISAIENVNFSLHKKIVPEHFTAIHINTPRQVEQLVKKKKLQNIIFA
jgi:hypothetical protein